jgi:hypothetical protein
MSNRWIQTRPFGKQYNCNAMGIAAVSSSADLMSKLNLLYWDHNYLNGCSNAQIIYLWLNKYQHEAAINLLLVNFHFYLILFKNLILDNCLELVRKKNYVRQYLENKVGYPSTSICTGPSTSYLLFEVPKIYLEDKTKSKSEISEQFSDDLYFATGVMLSGNLFSHSNSSSYVRLHLGSDPANLEQIMKRFQNAGLNYHMKHKFNSFSSKISALTDKLLSFVSN